MTLRLENKIALVTGAAQGIGAAIAHQFEAQGAADTAHRNVIQPRRLRRLLAIAGSVTDADVLDQGAGGQRITRLLTGNEKGEDVARRRPVLQRL